MNVLDLVLVVTASSSGVVPLPVDDDALARAAAAKGASNWVELESVARERLSSHADDRAAIAYLATALAGLRRFDECVVELERLGDPDRSVASFGAPLDEVINTIYGHCWSNFDAEFNRACWSGLFRAFPEGRSVRVAASRLLMAAIKLDDGPEADRLRGWFDRRIEAARDDGHDPHRLLESYIEGFIRADRADEGTLQMAAELYRHSSESAATSRGFDPNDPDPAKRDLVHVDVDRPFHHLARAAFLAGAFDPERNPLAAEEALPAVTFADVTGDVGLDGVRRSRVAAADYDDDGDPDLCFGGRLYRNDAGRFVDVTGEVGLTRTGVSSLFGDVDNDGDLDLLIPAKPHPFLFLNGGPRIGHVFTDETAASGLDAVSCPASPEGAVLVDFDRDGWLDLYLAVYEQPMSVGHPDLLLRNRGDGTFEDGSGRIPGDDSRCGRGVTCADFDGDGAPEIVVSNYRLQANRLLVPAEDGTLVDRAVELGVQGVEQRQYYGHTIGSVAGDVDGDGDLDLLSANLAHPRFVAQGFSNLTMLYMNQGERFTEERALRGIRFQETHSDPALVDIDNDGDLDLSITCVYEGRVSALYQNDGSGHFSPITFRSRGMVFNGWGQAWLDHDGDGDLDVCYASGSGVRFLRNDGGDRGNHVRVRLRGRETNRFAIGARVTVETLEDEPRVIVREVRAGRGTTSQDDAVLHFGLGSFKGRVRITVRWPEDGVEEGRASFINRTVTIHRRKRGR